MKQNNELASNLDALRQHLDYRAGTRTGQEIRDENVEANRPMRRTWKDKKAAGKREPSLSYQENNNAGLSARAGKYDL